MEDETPQNVMNLDLNLGPVETEPGGLNIVDWLDVGESIGGRRAAARRMHRSMLRSALGNGTGPEPDEGSVAGAGGRSQSPPSESIGGRRAMVWRMNRSLLRPARGSGTGPEPGEGSVAGSGGRSPSPPSESIGGRRAMVWRMNRSLLRPALGSRAGPEPGEGSVAGAGGRSPSASPLEVAKTCDNSNGHQENEVVSGKDKEDVAKGDESEGGFFDCNICLDMATDPVVTYCGHLFCWPCLYRWLHIHSDVKECPICKGEMTMKTVTPIYGRGNPARVVEEDSGLKIPNRPQAKRVESFRQTIQRNVFTMPMEEMIRRLGSRFDLTRDIIPGHSFLPENPREVSDRNNLLLNRYLASRRSRTDQDQIPTLGEPFRGHQERAPSMEDRDSVSSIAAVIQSESQTVDTAVEIDSRVSLSTSSSRRRSESSRVSDVDSGDSRASRRRRLI